MDAPTPTPPFSVSERLDPARLRTLIAVGGLIFSQLDLDAILDRVLTAACEMTGARYAALGVLNEQRTELERFVTRGMSDDAEATIGPRPRGRGVLGVLIEDPRPLLLDSVGRHPASYGFPAGHPPMETFLGVPIVIRGQAWGNLYLTERATGTFTQADEEAISVLAGWTGIAVENARLYQGAEQQRSGLERAVRGLQATQAVARAIGAETELDRVLELIVKRGRALVEARTVVILLREDEELLLAAIAGHGRRTEGTRIPVRGSTSGEVMLRDRPERIGDVRARLRIAAEELGVDDAATALVVPLTYRGQPLGVLLAFDRGPAAVAFDEDDEQALDAFAASAATAVAMAQSVRQERLRETLAAGEAERRRWAQELHDETLQGLGGLRLLLSSARGLGDPAALARATGEAIEQIEQEITNLRAIITELRPAALDALGLAPALEALLERHRTVHGLEVGGRLRLPENEALAGIGPELQATTYRVVQEALTNVAKHARASAVRVDVEVDDGAVRVRVADDGRGFAVEETGAGFGLTGMRERVLAADGELAIDSSDGGTVVSATLPLAQRSASRATGSSSPRLSA